MSYYLIDDDFVLETNEKDNLAEIVKRFIIEKAIEYKDSLGKHFILREYYDRIADDEDLLIIKKNLGQRKLSKTLLKFYSDTNKKDMTVIIDYLITYFDKRDNKTYHTSQLSFEDESNNATLKKEFTYEINESMSLNGINEFIKAKNYEKYADILNELDYIALDFIVIENKKRIAKTIEISDIETLFKYNVIKEISEKEYKVFQVKETFK